MQSRIIKNGEKAKQEKKEAKNSSHSRNSFPRKEGQKKEYDGQFFSRSNFTTASVQSALEASQYADEVVSRVGTFELARINFKEVLTELVTIAQTKEQKDAEDRQYEEYLAARDKDWASEDDRVDEQEELEEADVDADIEAEELRCASYVGDEEDDVDEVGKLSEIEFDSGNSSPEQSDNDDLVEEDLRETTFIPPVAKTTRSSASFTFASKPREEVLETSLYTHSFRF
jgi:hypothetical protein